MSYEQKQKHTVAILTGLADGPVECEVSDSGEHWTKRSINRFCVNCYAPWGYSDTVCWRFARPIPPRKRVPWTPEQIMMHGVFEDDLKNKYVVVYANRNKIRYVIDGIVLCMNYQYFINNFRAVVRETLPSGQVVDTGRRLELWKEVGGDD